MKTVMQKHLEWLRVRMYISPNFINALLEEEKTQLADFLDWLIDNPEAFNPNKPSNMLADEFIKSRK